MIKFIIFIKIQNEIKSFGIFDNFCNDNIKDPKSGKYTFILKIPQFINQRESKMTY
jgi:hypothetical protein